MILIPNKALSQHFLIDKNVIKKIIREAHLSNNDVVLEIGAGRGELTFPIAEKVFHVFAVEKDKRLFYSLKNYIKQKNIKNISIINNDILELNFFKILPSIKHAYKIVVIGNIPYKISSPILNKLIKNRYIIKKSIIMLQLEFARRLIASPGNKEYGAITLIINYYANVRKLFEVSRNVFFPKPNVNSMVIEVKFSDKYSYVNEKIFHTIVHGAFLYRRKHILNSLSKYLKNRITKEELKHILISCKIDPKQRAESLNIDKFLAIATQLSSILNNNTVDIHKT